jgi:SAM-dependent methyltransferase
LPNSSGDVVSGGKRHQTALSPGSRAFALARWLLKPRQTLVRILDNDTDISQLLYPALVDPRCAVTDQDDVKVALARLVDGLPFADASFSAVACLYVLYHLDDPLVAISEAFRVLKPDGLFAAATVASSDSPELHEYVPPTPSPFDAEEAPSLVGRAFSDVEIDLWDGPLLTLPDAAALREYLIGRQASAETIERAAGTVRFPLTVTKRGVLMFGHKR